MAASSWQTMAEIARLLLKGQCPSCDHHSSRLFGHLLRGILSYLLEISFLPWLLETTAEMFRVNKMELHLIQQWLNHVAPLCTTPRIQVPSPHRRASLQPHKFLEIRRHGHMRPISGWKRSIRWGRTASLSMATKHLFLSGMSAWREGRTHMYTPFSHEITYNILVRVKCRLFYSVQPLPSVVAKGSYSLRFRAPFFSLDGGLARERA